MHPPLAHWNLHPWPKAGRHCTFKGDCPGSVLTAAGVHGTGAVGATVQFPPGGGKMVFPLLAIFFDSPFFFVARTFRFKFPVQKGQPNLAPSATTLLIIDLTNCTKKIL